jgi:hypothetical protein
MKRFLIPFIVVLLLALAVPAFADWEFGVSGTPQLNPVEGNVEFLTGYHLGYTVSIFAASLDSIAVPSWLIAEWSNYTVPGFLNLFDLGVKLYFRPLIVYAEAGINNLYIYQVGMLPGLGANLRVGAGLRFGWWGIDLAGTETFPSWDALQKQVGGLFNADMQAAAFNQIVQQLVPSVQFNFYF